MSSVLKFLFLMVFFFGCTTKQVHKWESLFDGKSLRGWKPKIKGFELNDNYKNTFRVEDGLIKVSYDQYDSFENRFGHLFYEESFASYRLLVEYRFVGEQVSGGEGWAFKNSGIMFHSQSPESMLRDQDFPISLEAQFLGGNGSDRPTMNLCTPGVHVIMEDSLVTDHCINSSSPTIHNEEWVIAEIEVYEDSLINHYVNGELVLSYSKPVIGGGMVHEHDPSIKKDGVALKEGYIALQSESHPIHFRKVEILDLSNE